MSYEIRNTDVFDGLAAMPEQSVHCCVTSPPYWALRDYGVAGQIGQEATPQEFVATLVRVFAGVHRVLRDDGVLFVNLGDSYASKQRCLVPERFVLAMQEFGWYVRDVIIWRKPAPMPVSVRDRCTPAWEPIFQFTKKPRYFWDAEAVKSATANPRNVMDTPLESLSRDELLDLLQCGTGDMENVWRISTEPLKAKHYAAFPSKLPTFCIKAATSERGVCSKCGAPWVRVVERSRVATRPGVDSKVLGDVSKKNRDRIAMGMHQGSVASSTLGSLTVGNRDPQRHVTQTQTVDWKPSCECGGYRVQSVTSKKAKRNHSWYRRRRTQIWQDKFGPPTPATVLDPFSGAGTTCLAAHRLGRHGIGLELSAEYCRLSRERIEAEDVVK